MRRRFGVNFEQERVSEFVSKMREETEQQRQKNNNTQETNAIETIGSPINNKNTKNQ